MDAWSLVPIISGVAIAIVGVVGTWLGRRGSRENDLIDQLQEEVRRLHDQVATHGEKISALQSELFSFRSRELVWQSHTSKLEGHLIRLGAQPAERPAALATIPFHMPTPLDKEKS